MPESRVWIYCWIQLLCIIIKSIKLKIIDGACFVSMQLLTLNINILMAQFLTIIEKKREIRLLIWNNKPLKFKQGSYLKNKCHSILYTIRTKEYFKQLWLIILALDYMEEYFYAKKVVCQERWFKIFTYVSTALTV